MAKRYKWTIPVLVVFLLSTTGIKAQDPSWSIDVIGGSPYMISNVKGGVSPFGGFGLRYAINPVFSGQFQVNGGVFTGNSDATNAVFSNNFLQYSFRGLLNIGGLVKKPASLSRFNAYVYAGAGHVKCYKRQNFTDVPDRNMANYNSLFYTTHLGLNIRYYLNENIDFIIGSEMNFTQTHILDNNPGGDYDKFLMNYVGVSFKLLPEKRQKQSPEWMTMKLQYQLYEEQLKMAQARAAEAEAKEATATKEAIHAKTEAKADLAKAEATSLGVMKEMSAVFFKLDTIRVMLATMNGQPNKPGNNNANAVPKTINPVSRSLYAANPVPAQNKPAASFTGLAENTTGANYYAIPVRYEIPSQESYEAAAEATATVNAIDHNQKFAIVLGSYVKPVNAFNARKTLSEKGYNVDVVHFSDPKVQRLIIYSGSMEDASSRLNEIRENGHADAWLLNIR